VPGNPLDELELIAQEGFAEWVKSDGLIESLESLDGDFLACISDSECPLGDIEG
jgi:hypothetical protein